MIEQLLDIPLESYIQIENIKTFILDKIESYHPSDPRYLTYWRDQKKKCIEGIWGKEFGKYRYMPGNLYFYGNYCIIIDTDHKRKIRKKLKPFVHDLEWEQAYAYLEAKGFSGWSDDDIYTSNALWYDYNLNGIPKIDDVSFNSNLINSKGELKKYKTPRENIRSLHSEVMGSPLYENQACNNIILGSRGGGKSYFASLGICLYEISFDGIKHYDHNDLEKSKIEICVGSGDTDKSGEFFGKIVDCMNEFALNQDLGVFGKQGESGWTPNPFYKDMSGPTGSGNKEKGGWVHKYKKKVNGRFVDGFGTGTKAYHVSYSDKKKNGAEAAAGGRYHVSIIEETGLTSNVQEVYNSNNATVQTEGQQFGVQWFLGTSGNIDLIQPSKEMFTKPSDYGLLEYEDIWEKSGKIGFFLPAYMTFRQFKDKNGNTDLKKAKEHWVKDFYKAKKSKNPKKLRMYCMNYPAIPSHMWVTDKNYLLPYSESVLKEKELMVDNIYERVGTNIDLTWDTTKPDGIDYTVDHGAHPFYFFPIRKDRESLDGGIRIYEFPNKINGLVPRDMYLFFHDPYVSENIEDGESLGVTYVVLNPKYTANGYNGNTIVATYIAKTLGGKEVYYRNLEKLMAFYGNPIRGLWFEANRGEDCKNYFMKKGKTSLLCLRPVLTKGTGVFTKLVPEYGYMVGNKIAKISMVDNLHDLLISDTTYNGSTKKVIETINCIWTQRQIQFYNLEGNFDGISALLGWSLAVNELEYVELEKLKKKGKNRLAFLSANKNQFNVTQKSQFYDVKS